MTTNAIECEEENGTKPFRITFHTLLAPYSTFRMQNKSMEKIQLNWNVRKQEQFNIKYSSLFEWQK